MYPILHIYFCLVYHTLALWAFSMCPAHRQREIEKALTVEKNRQHPFLRGLKDKGCNRSSKAANTQAISSSFASVIFLSLFSRILATHKGATLQFPGDPCIVFNTVQEHILYNMITGLPKIQTVLRYILLVDSEEQPVKIHLF